MPVREKILIARLRERAARQLNSRRLRAQVKTGGAVICGIGDDAAVLRIPPGHQALVTTDFSLEDVHFRLAWDSAEAIGHRTLLRGLSDIAAMGGEPTAAFLSLALPAQVRDDWVERFLAGLLNLARRFGVSLAGGDTSQSPQKILADIIVVGSVPSNRAILRSGAQVGDRIYVTGRLGASAARLAELYSAGARTRPPSGAQDRLGMPRIALGRALRRLSLATSMIDLSDGLSTDLDHLCQESRVGAQIWEEAIPRAAWDGDRVEMKFALHGGEDYELLFTARRKRRMPKTIDGIRITEIGTITRGRKAFLVNSSGRQVAFGPAGWEHFAPHSGS
ncbi:MAG: thiamine-phosphate kinase [Acidobacteria bacterium]|nr:thiamine-phosphate kinase [Acidobacteriota bacterium]